MFIDNLNLAIIFVTRRNCFNPCHNHHFCDILLTAVTGTTEKGSAEVDTMGSDGVSLGNGEGYVPSPSPVVDIQPGGDVKFVKGSSDGDDETKAVVDKGEQ